MSSLPAPLTTYERLGNGRRFGVWLTRPSRHLIDVVAGAGVDYIGIDCQHGAVGEESLPELLAGTCAVPRIVRVADASVPRIARALDSGADGIIVPMVDSATDATAAVAAVRFPPHGIRSYGPLAPHLSRDPASLGSVPLVLAMIETRSGVADAAAILDVDGIDGIYIGPADLGISLGHGPGQFPPSGELRPMLAEIAEAATSRGKVAGVHAAAGAIAPAFLDLGFDLLTLGTEDALVRGGIAAELAQAGREQGVGVRNGTY
ncbi:probable 2-dehydro-3-deoxyglucarate aldolase (plasmid) [Rhodococcus jostii RHA1]|jgi:2-dehydro-3-deoxyglucarate aldolase|uniref:Probable 2-dehydro-3-deoxyglucarate aldolase n=1 Tax=Rhodococcus jostii (strain RHA1) TaxID=101510 RepID=Q0RW61_RHOJR|nr:aldolase/citrate lyase family protein [Rhodococcus jostii]ABH00475.1 probable 2-dehydro-3-deoxyglucarate aldolase [Rhodococcus jostii RHA1]